MDVVEARMSWSSVADAQGYRVFHAGEEIFDAVGVAKCSVELLLDSGDQQFAVEAYNAHGSGGRVERTVQYVSPNDVPPAAVEGFDVNFIYLRKAFVTGDQPPEILSTPAPAFASGVASQYDLSQHVSDDGFSDLRYELSGSLPSGVTLDADTGLLSYDGQGASGSSSHTLTVSDKVDSATSSSFSISISGGVSWDFVPDIEFTRGVASNFSVSAYLNDPGGEVEVTFVSESSPSLPAGVSYSDENRRFEYDGTDGGSDITVTGIVLVADTAPLSVPQWNNNPVA
jgi:hypothetical protein